EHTLWAPGGGFYDFPSSPTDPGALRYPDRPFEMNAEAARFLLDLALATGERGYRAIAERTLALLSPLAGRYGVAGAGFALAVEEFFDPPYQVVIVGNDDTAGELRRAALSLQEPGGRVWTLEKGGRIGQSEYPPQDGGAAYLCRARSRSRPVRLPDDLLAAASAAR
ncbi:MAG TPA: hypothetical protein VNZ57_07105, partial [Longimicrobiales bacterium]|nr:hypothetical protein [Longimicrobiales bacterium]